MRPPRSLHPAAIVVLLILLWLAFATGSRAQDLSVHAVIPAAIKTEVSDYDVFRTHLVEWEGYRVRPYRDGTGYSVGIGHSLTMNGEKVIWSRPYTAAEIDALYCRDVSWALDSCRRGIRDFDALPLAVRQVCVGIAFTVGRTGFDRFIAFRLALSWRAFDSAATQMGLSKWANEVPPARFNAYLRILRAAH